jgi:two-component system, cell cycle response regulator DivK
MSNFQDLQVLIVEDDQPSIAVLQNLLKRSGVQDIMALDGYSVADQLSMLPTPDVIFLDLEMPRMNGYEVLGFLRNNERFADSKIIAYSTHTSHLNEAKAAGFSGFMGKPLDPYRFADLLERVMNGEQVWEVS